VRAVAALLLLGAAALGGDDDPVRPLLVRLDSPRPAVRVDATRALGRIDDPRALDAVRKAQGDASPDVRHEAALALAKSGNADETTIAILARSLEGDWYVRWQACVAAKRIGPAAVSLLPTLCGLLGDDSAEVSREAALAIAAMASEDPRTLQALTAAIAGGKGDRAALFEALSRCGEAAVPMLLAEIRNPGADFREQAFRALRAIAEKSSEQEGPLRPDDPALRSLLEEIGNPDSRLREQAFAALRDIVLKTRAVSLAPDDPAVRVLLAEIRSPDSPFRERAFLTLRAVAPKSLATYAELLDSDEPVVRAFGASGLGGTRSRKTYAQLARALGDGSADVRVAGALAAEEMGKFAWKALPDLVPLLADESEPVRDAARGAIRAAGAEELADLVSRRQERIHFPPMLVVLDLTELHLPIERDHARALLATLTDPDIGTGVLRALGRIPFPGDVQDDLEAMVNATSLFSQAAVANRTREVSSLVGQPVPGRPEVRQYALLLLPHLATDLERARKTIENVAEQPDLKKFAERALATLDARK